MSARVVTYRIAPRRDVAAPRIRIAVVADIHACRPIMDARRIGRIVDETNALGADLICLLGDYAGHAWLTWRLSPDEVVPQLCRLSAPLGVVAVMGNHDWKDDPAARKGRAPETLWHRAFRDAGLAMLNNDLRRIGAPGAAVTLAGIESQRAHGRRPDRRRADDFETVARRLDPDRYTILLAHEPDIFPGLPDHVDLTLSGHLHGGQIRAFGRAWVAPSAYGTRFAMGHFAAGSKQMVVSAGLGCSGPPFRIGVPPEITLVEIG